MCPFCQRDKSGDQATHAVLLAFIVLAGGIGYLVNGFIGFIAGAFIGGLAGAVVGIAMSLSQSSEAPEVRLQEPLAPTPDPAESRSVERLQELVSLRERGLI